jgi:Fe-S-cluster containining protein
MHMFQGKEGGVYFAEMPALTLANLNYDYQNEIRSAHESNYPSLPNNTPLCPFLDSREEAAHSTHTYLGVFYKYPV